MLKKIREKYLKKILNQEGSTLLEVMVAFMIMALVLVAFSTMIVASTRLSRDAYYERKVSEQAFVKFENSGLGTPSGSDVSSAFQVIVHVEAMSRQGVTYADGKTLDEVAPGTDIEIGSGGLPYSVQLLKDMKFYRYNDALSDAPERKVQIYELKKG
jgi:hypothetical protein